MHCEAVGMAREHLGIANRRFADGKRNGGLQESQD